MSDQKWDATKLGGSMKRNIVNPDLLEERAKLAFDRYELQRFTVGEWLYDKNAEVEVFFNKHEDVMKGSAEEYEMTREELLEHYWKRIKLINEAEPKWMTENSVLVNKFFSWNSFQ